ncbi:SIR2-like domain-containing protein [Paenimyroides aquimaris]|uniref:SIR2-like domain-containing protein n=1 Tax=Paenimyroides marinum TaxID=1159016 RepID=A0A1H6KXW0_9FLAO|nr:SIR2 family protein [Paenimyroides aquimaris]SEH76851.1 SIR2-like domain-containing protein [Paenimyroides aquimaris]
MDKGILKYDDLKKIIESCHLNFLIGSGLSAPYLSILGKIEELLTANESSDQPNKIIEVSIKKFYFDQCIKGNLALLDTSLCEKSKKDEFKKANENYCNFIKSLHTILSYRESNIVSKQVNLFTTNMDLFLDKTIEDLGFVLNDGFSGRINPKFGTENFHNSIHKYSSHYEYKSELPLFNLFKMHGSVNWKRINENTANRTYEITNDSYLEILKNISNIDIKEEHVTPIITGDKDKNGRDISFTYEELLQNIASIEKKEIHDEYLKYYGELVMINPTKDKFRDTTSNFYFYELLRMYANHLEKENSVLFVIGFSFADEHIKEITKRVLKSNPTLIIVIFCKKGDKEGFTNMFNNVNNVVCLSPEDDNHYSLDKVNDFLFEELSHDLKFGITKSKYIEMKKQVAENGESN